MVTPFSYPIQTQAPRGPLAGRELQPLNQLAGGSNPSAGTIRRRSPNTKSGGRTSASSAVVRQRTPQLMSKRMSNQGERRPELPSPVPGNPKIVGLRDHVS